MFSRRSLLKIIALSAVSGIAYSYYRSIRFPTLSWEPFALKKNIALDHVNINFNDLIQTPANDQSVDFRAYAPEPEINLRSEKKTQISLVVNNIANDAILQSNHDDGSTVKEQVQGINRILELYLEAGKELRLKWVLPQLEEYKFAAIGDTGGDKELAWCIHRAQQLGARFLLHLGDFNYQDGDYDNAVKLFKQAALPCYVSIGNHDFNDSGLIYQQFLDEIGPLNNYFSIGKTRFINLDTAASMLPYSGGLRGKLVEHLIADKTAYNDNVVFTHRPLHDPQPLKDREKNGDHDIGNSGERDWLIKSLKSINATTLLSGHIHIFDRSTFQGIENIIAGQGLGHQDLLVNKDVSKMVLGHVNLDGVVHYDTAPLAMPMELHCHPRVQVVKDEMMHLPHAQTIRDINAACEQ